MTKRHNKKQCSRCNKPIKRDKFHYYAGIPLRVSLDGGYMEFVDSIVFGRSSLIKYPLYHWLCHECAHEFTRWLNIPDKEVSHWHPNVDQDSWCCGWETRKPRTLETDTLPDNL